MSSHVSEPTYRDTESVRPGALSALTILWLVNFVSLVDRVQIPTLLQPIKEEFHLSDAQLGLLSGTAFGLTYAIAALPLAALSDRYSRRRLLTGALLFWGIMTALAGTAKSFSHLVLTRMGVAGGEAAFTPTAHSLLADYFPPSRRGWAIGIETSGGPLGIMGGMLLAGFIGSACGWRVAMFVASVPAIILAVVVFLFLKDPPRTISIDGPGVVEKRPPFRWLGAHYVALVMIAILNSIMTTGWTQWLPSFFLRSHGMSLHEVGAWVGISTGTGLLLGSVAGAYASVYTARRGPRAPYIFCTTVCSLLVPCFILTLWLSHPGAAFVLVALSAILGGMLAPFIFSDIQAICDPSNRARAVAAAMTLVTIGSYALMPALVGAASDFLKPGMGIHSLRGALSILAIAPVIAAILFLWLARLSTRRDAIAV